MGSCLWSFDVGKSAKINTLTINTFQIPNLKPNLGQFGPKTFGKGLIKPLVENPSSNFHKQDLIFSRIMSRMQ